jgi:hypothetical protein
MTFFMGGSAVMTVSHGNGAVPRRPLRYAAGLGDPPGGSDPLLERAAGAVQAAGQTVSERSSEIVFPT